MSQIHTIDVPAGHRRTRRQMVLGGSAVASALLAACGPQLGGQQAGPAAQKPATVQWYKYFTAQNMQEVPDLLNQFHAVAPQITVDVILRPGGAWITEDYKTITCDRPEVIDAYQSFFDLRDKHRVWPQTGERADFRQQNVAFSVLGAWELKEYAGLADLDWAFAPFPKVKLSSPQAYVLDNKIIRGSPNREPAWTFTKWISEESRLASFEGRPPAIKAVVPRWTSVLFKDKPNARPSVLNEGMNVAVTPELLWFHPRWAGQMSLTVADDFWKPVNAGQKAVAAALQEIKPSLQQTVAAR